jgi:hypothetical protein
MSERDHIDRCADCAADAGPFEQHHIALRANHQTATVPLCKAPAPCHDEQTARQHEAGLIDRRGASPRDALALLHALTEGVAGIFTAHARRAGYEPLIRDIERDRRATLHLLASLPDVRPGTRGPRPISNDRRRRAGGRRQAPGTPAPAPNVADSLQALAGILPALATAISGPPRPGAAALLTGAAELLPGVTVGCLSELLTPSGARGIARNLAALEDHPRVGELAAVIARVHALGLDFSDQVAKATAADGLGS